MMLFAAAETMPFSVALAILLGLAVIEGIGAVLAFSPSLMMENLLTLSPESDGGLGWLHVGKVPLLILLVLLLLGFSLGGYAIQIVAHSLLGIYLPTLFAAVPAFFIGLSTVRGLGVLATKIMPKDESVAVSETTLIGRVGSVVTGTARTGMAAEVRVRDEHGRSHYLMLEPDVEGDAFEQGSEVLIVRRAGSVYRGIRNPYPTPI
jgi:uncharacterized membrane protein YeaQ/YmgE (transglycosylase-associated protein family)